MDTIEEIPIADISATYLTDEQFNNLYPKHPIDVSKYLLIVIFNLSFKVSFLQIVGLVIRWVGYQIKLGGAPNKVRWPGGHRNEFSLGPDQRRRSPRRPSLPHLPPRYSWAALPIR